MSGEYTYTPWLARLFLASMTALDIVNYVLGDAAEDKQDNGSLVDDVVLDQTTDDSFVFFRLILGRVCRS